MSEMLSLIRIVLKSKNKDRTKKDLVVSANKIFSIIDVLLKMSLKLSLPEPCNILNTEKNLFPKETCDRSF